MKELFKLSEVSSESPRLVWLKRHEMKTRFHPDIAEGDGPWSAWTGDLTEAIERDSYGVGETEDDALCDWAKKNGHKLWNEE